MLLADAIYAYYLEKDKDYKDESKKLFNKSLCLSEELCALLNPEQKKLFNELDSIDNELQCLEIEQYFTDGFKCAIKLLLECLL